MHGSPCDTNTAKRTTYSSAPAIARFINKSHIFAILRRSNQLLADAWRGAAARLDGTRPLSPGCVRPARPCKYNHMTMRCAPLRCYAVRLIDCRVAESTRKSGSNTSTKDERVAGPSELTV